MKWIGERSLSLLDVHQVTNDAIECLALGGDCLKVVSDLGDVFLCQEIGGGVVGECRQLLEHSVADGAAKILGL